MSTDNENSGTVPTQLARPAEPPPPGVQSNFDNPNNMKLAGEVCLHTTFAICTLVFAIHMFTQLRIARKLRVEDWLLLLTWMVLTGAFVPVSALIAHMPIGVHQWDITVQRFNRYLFLEYTSWIIWGIIILLLKAIILLQYIRIFSPNKIHNLNYWASHILLWINILFYVSFTFLQMFSCNPREAIWDKTITPHKCLDVFAINVASAATCLVSDLAVFILPQRVVLRLRTSARKKYGICCLFAIGILACVTSVVRLYYDIIIWKYPHDVTYKLAHMNMWAVAQIGAGFLIICLPSMPKFFNYLRSTRWCVITVNYWRLVLSTSVRDAECVKVRPDNVATIGGGCGHDVKRAVISDREYHDLVNTEKTTTSSRNQMA